MHTILTPPGTFTPGLGYRAFPHGGIPPYEFTVAPSPPNPPGVTIVQNGMFADIDCPPGTPPGMKVVVIVKDSSDPQQTADASNRVG